MPEPTDDGVVASALRDVLRTAAATRPPEPPADLRARSGRRARRVPDLKLVLTVAAAVIVVAVLVTAGVVHRSAKEPVHVSGSGRHSFSIRPVLCHAAPYAPSSAAPTPGGLPTSGVLPACSPSSALTAANIGISPDADGVGGYSSNLGSIVPDGALAAYPSTPGAQVTAGATVLLPGEPGAGGGRFVLGPAGITGADVASATVVRQSGQVSIDLHLTPAGATRWDDLARRQFHAIVGVVVDGRVVSAPVTQPTQSSFTSFDGSLQISGSLTAAQAGRLASWIPGSR